MTPEEREVAREQKLERKTSGKEPKFSPDSKKGLTETMQYANGESETFERYKRTTDDYGSFGKTPPPPKPFRPKNFESNLP
ncbi:hypothetical protein ScalyP_jg3641 [Parmales sp. scaly parma]|nr:hypothetical protein ScalyP_jg3641 [Parmales sp. scaly parma]